MILIFIYITSSVKWFERTRVTREFLVKQIKSMHMCIFRKREKWHHINQIHTSFRVFGNVIPEKEVLHESCHPRITMLQYWWRRITLEQAVLPGINPLKFQVPPLRTSSSHLSLNYYWLFLWSPTRSASSLCLLTHPSPPTLHLFSLKKPQTLIHRERSPSFFF